MSGWRPSAGHEVLRRRAEYLRRLRAFFAVRDVLEVETPLLGQSSCLDPQVPSYAVPQPAAAPRWLQTSPENHMKRLLAAGSGAIYRLGPVFREAEVGRWHGPEFTLLEWYQPGYDDQRLMREVAELIAELGGPTSVVHTTYAEALAEHTGLDLFRSPDAELARYCAGQGLENAPQLDRDALLDYLFAVVIGPRLGQDGLHFITHYPASQAALARLDGQDARVARRFELYWQGLELANGFHELCDAAEQQARFEAEAAHRRRQGLADIPLDEHLMGALREGLPDCAGVALGVDRLLALLMGAGSLAAVQAFAWERA